ncbi:hypothetical protein PR202_gb00153 [Eleusine coracana subsp. coracana]|uniref:Uncharacterized protein n=1 Tax=Eleusine coracana subsp. coracana TaxID=191504 RepID=A0AAV5DSN4_ELECO|nr:hypothetical protein PR202_gb00153 [Eleusine coracana subsp. coracana]
MITSTRAQVIFVLETRTLKITQAQLINRFSVMDSHVVPATGESRGLWLMWNDEVDMSIIRSSHHLILANGICKPTNQNYKLVCIYGDTHHHRTAEIWEEVHNFVLASLDIPTFCMGDLNNIMHVNKKYGPGQANFNHIQKFCCLVKEYGLFYLGFSGPAYTWTNKVFLLTPLFKDSIVV